MNLSTGTRRLLRLFPVGVWVLVTALAARLNADEAVSAAALARLRAELPAKTTAEITASDFASVPLTKQDAAVARELIYQDYVTKARKEREQELAAGVLAEGDLAMPFIIREFGKAPPAGHSVWISLHGGGGAPKAVNDGQWQNQKRLYTLEEGLYVVPRAPTNTWNLWHEAHIDRLFARLIQDLVIAKGADPDRVYVMGYSAGGDGVYQLAPRMADYWAAAAMMAGHPNDASPLGLRNLPFALQVGANDAAYNRNKVAIEWGTKLDQLREADPNGYEHFVKIHEGLGHWMNLQDAAALPWMAKHRRHPTPDRVVWKQSPVTHDSFYWLAVPAGSAKAGATVTATIKGQSIEVSDASDIERLLIRVDDRLLNVDQPVSVLLKGRKVFDGNVRRTIAMLLRTLTDRGDDRLMFDGEIAIDLQDPAQ